MAVKIRLRRTGATNDPSFRVVAADARSPRDGKFLERLGWYDPKMTGKNAEFNLERINYWISQGAQVSDTVKSLIKAAAGADAGAAVKVTVAETVEEAGAAGEIAGEVAGEVAVVEAVEETPEA